MVIAAASWQMRNTPGSRMEFVVVLVVVVVESMVAEEEHGGLQNRGPTQQQLPILDAVPENVIQGNASS